MDDKLNNLLLVSVLILTVGIFAAYRWRTGTQEEFPQSPQEQEQQWNNWTPASPPAMPPANPEMQPELKQQQLPSSPLAQPKTYQEALSMAKSQNKKLFVYFEASWCKWCKKMKSETLSDQSVKSALSKYIVYYADKDREGALAAKFGVTGIPAYVIISSTEQVEKSGNGYKSAREFTNWLEGNERRMFPNQQDRRDNRKSFVVIN